MKLSTTTTTLLLFATPILAGVAPANAADECGQLGVMSYTAGSMDEKGVDPSQIRKCKEHPLGSNPRPEGAVGTRPNYAAAAAAAEDTNSNTSAPLTAEHWWWKHGWERAMETDGGAGLLGTVATDRGRLVMQGLIAELPTTLAVGRDAGLVAVLAERSLSLIPALWILVLSA